MVSLISLTTKMDAMTQIPYSLRACRTEGSLVIDLLSQNQAEN